MATIKLSCHVGVGPEVSGEALVTDDNFSARYDLDRIAGIFSRPQHKLAGQSYVDKIMVFNTAKGGVASAWMLHEMKSRGVAPWRRAPRSPTWHCAIALTMATSRN
jgi:predicted aconitase with swiveling domain